MGESKFPMGHILKVKLWEVLQKTLKKVKNSEAPYKLAKVL